MTETGLLAFQIAEILAAAKYIVCTAALIFGVSLWVHATSFRKDD